MELNVEMTGRSLPRRHSSSDHATSPTTLGLRTTPGLERKNRTVMSTALGVRRPCPHRLLDPDHYGHGKTHPGHTETLDKEIFTIV